MVKAIIYIKYYINWELFNYKFTGRITLTLLKADKIKFTNLIKVNYTFFSLYNKLEALVKIKKDMDKLGLFIIGY